MFGWLGRGWGARAAIVEMVLSAIEGSVVLALFGWAAAGMIAFGRETGWTMKGLLTLMDSNWRGVLILGLVLFSGSVRRALRRIGSLKIGDHEVKLQAVGAVAPAREPEAIDR